MESKEIAVLIVATLPSLFTIIGLGSIMWKNQAVQSQQLTHIKADLVRVEKKMDDTFGLLLKHRDACLSGDIPRRRPN